MPWTGEALDYGDKATNKAATSAQKYYLMRQFNISEKGEDPDADSPDKGTVNGPKPQVTPKPAPKPAIPAKSGPITNSQAGMLVGMAKHVSGLTNKSEILDFFKEETGVDITNVKQQDIARIEAVFGGDIEVEG